MRRTESPQLLKKKQNLDRVINQERRYQSVGQITNRLSLSNSTVNQAPNLTQDVDDDASRMSFNEEDSNLNKKCRPIDRFVRFLRKEKSSGNKEIHIYECLIQDCKKKVF